MLIKAGTPAACVGLYTFVLKYILADAKSRAELSVALRSWKVWSSYRSMLRRSIGLVDTFFGSERPISAAVWRRCFQIALVYPLLLVVLGWVLGGPSSFVGVSILPDGLQWWKRIAIGGALLAWGLLFGFLWRRYTSQEPTKPRTETRTGDGSTSRKWIRRTTPVIILLTLLVAGAAVRVATILTAQGTAFTLAFAASIAFAFAGGMAFTQQSAPVLVLAVATAAACGVESQLVDSSPAVSTSLVIGVFVTLSLPAVLLPSVKPLATSLASAASMTGLLVFGLLGSIALGFAGKGAYSTSPGHLGMLYVWIIFFVLLPVLNSLFDVVSWGASRYLLRKVATQDASAWEILGHILLDLVLGMMLLFGLAMAAPFVIEFFNASSLIAVNVSPVEWSAYADAAGDAPWSAGLMVTAMLLSTLIPTACHFLLAGVAMVIRASAGRIWAARQLQVEDPSNVQKAIVSLWLTGYLVLSFALYGFICWFILWLVRFFGVSISEALREAADWAAQLAR